MKKIFLLATVLATTMGTSQKFAHAEDRVDDAFVLPASIHMFEDVPLGNWSYSALQKLSSKYEPQAKMSNLRSPLTRYEFAVAVLRCEDQADKTRIGLGERDLFVSLKYEYGLDVVGVRLLGQTATDVYYSDENKRKLLAFSQVAQEKYGTLNPDQWSDFLDEAQRSLLFAWSFVGRNEWEEG